MNKSEKHEYRMNSIMRLEYISRHKNLEHKRIPLKYFCRSYISKYKICFKS